MTLESAHFPIRFGESLVVDYNVHDGPEYEGEYTVTPTVEEQTLAVNGMLMTGDLVVAAIPYSEVTNTSNGKTVYIASEI